MGFSQDSQSLEQKSFSFPEVIRSEVVETLIIRSHQHELPLFEPSYAYFGIDRINHMNHFRKMSLRLQLRNFFQKFGLYLYTRVSLPTGIDVENDLRRFLPGHAFKTIFDIGANKGQSVAHFLREFPEAEAIHSFEPQKDVFEQLQQSVVGVSKAHCHHLAMGQEEKTVRFSPASRNDSTSLVNAEGNSNPTEEVKVTYLDAFCTANNINEIDLLKIDAEGMDLEVLKGAEKLLKSGKIHAIFIEFGFLKSRTQRGPWVPITDIYDYLYEFGFTVAAVYETVYRTEYNRFEASGFGNALLLHDKAFRPAILPK